MAIDFFLFLLLLAIFAGFVQHFLCVEHILLTGVQYGIHAADDTHGQDHIGVFATPKQVAQHVVGNAPNEGDYFVAGCGVH